VGTYQKDFYAGRPALTVNRFGKGTAWYIAAAEGKAGTGLLNAFYESIITSCKLPSALPDCKLPEGVTAQVRESADGRYVFVMNFNNAPAAVEFTAVRQDVLTGDDVSGHRMLPPYGVLVLKN
jgi:beta-galactosidase